MQLPTWYRQALDRGITYIVLAYDKAEGFVFCPANLEYPFRVGGDYAGSFDTNAERALDYYHQYLNEAYRDQVAWFIDFVEKIRRGEDFSLDDLQIEARSLRVLKGRWPW